ncbi:MAG: hypothetical protein RI894_142 [Bacteroidota bacterium]|jgi:hypothetical protein
MSAHLHLRDYKNGKESAEKALSSVVVGCDIWFELMEYYVLCAMHTESYLNALTILRKAKSHARFPRLAGVVREKWNIFELYLNYVTESQATKNPMYLAQRSKTFKLSKFLTDPILLAKEYRILTIQIVIVQILFLLDKKNKVAATERIEKLKMYANRQLKREEHFRMINFIRLIQQLPKSGYNEIEFGNIDKYLKRFKDNPMQYRGLIHELEFIPYEYLFKMMVQAMKD